MTHRKTRFALTLTGTAALALILSGCGQSEPETPPNAPDAFFAAISAHCGKAYAGTLASTDEADADFIDASMVMHVKDCSKDRIAIPFHVKTGEEWDRSRTWLITRHDDALRLKHDHRHADGKPDAVTMYGGDTVEAGTNTAQYFLVDQESIELFKKEDLAASVTNVWSVEIDEGTYAYQLKRTVDGGADAERLFRVEFDLSQEVDAPPAAWGWE